MVDLVSGEWGASLMGQERADRDWPVCPGGALKLGAGVSGLRSLAREGVREKQPPLVGWDLTWGPRVARCPHEVWCLRVCGTERAVSLGVGLLQLGVVATAGGLGPVASRSLGLIMCREH